MYGGNCNGTYVNSLLQLTSLLVNNGHDLAYDYIQNESLITRARNNLAHRFLKTDSDALLFIDADQGFDAEEVYKLITSGKKLIGAVSPMKNINWGSVIMANKFGQSDLESFSGHFNVNFPEDATEINLKEPVEVDSIGTGMMFIDRKVFDKVKPICLEYIASDKNGICVISEESEKITEYFATFIDENGVLLSEDFEFCRKWKSLGKKVYIAPWVRLTHTGSYVFKGKFAESMALEYFVSESLKNQQVEDQLKKEL